MLNVENTFVGVWGKADQGLVVSLDCNLYRWDYMAKNTSWAFSGGSWLSSGTFCMALEFHLKAGTVPGSPKSPFSMGEEKSPMEEDSLLIF